MTIATRLAAVLLAGLAVADRAMAADRPNILWITAEDASPNLGCFGDRYATTPNIDRLAASGIRYTRAFASAPVCSPVRSGIITAMYATSLGTQRLRSSFPVPAEVRPFTEALRQAGYYCTNRVKTDYNLLGEPAFVKAAWDECSNDAHYRHRRPGQPFFAVFNITTTHQSFASVMSHALFEKLVGSQLSAGERHDPARAPLPPYYPDTAEARRTLARYYDCITAMDHEAGQLLDELAQQGLAEETIVFFYPDHGRGLPRGKRTLYDSGLQIPLVVRFPAKYQPLAPAAAGGTCDRLVTTIDFGPTVLSLAGLPVPRYAQGVPFLAATAQPREFVYGARDRVDEAIDVVRSVRDGRYLYIRNFMPHLSSMQPEGYSDQSALRQEMKQLAAAGKLGPGPMTYAAPRRPLEELYDTEADPHQVHNLAGLAEQEHRLAAMRARLRARILETRDTGFLSEPQAWARIGNKGTPRETLANDDIYPLERIVDAADLVGRPEAVSRQRELLADGDDAVRYWAAVGLHAAGKAASAAQAELRKAMADSSVAVRIEAAAALVDLGDGSGLALLEQELRSNDLLTVTLAARALELLGPKAAPVLPAMREVLKNDRRGDQGMYIGFSLEAATRALDGAASRASVE